MLVGIRIITLQPTGDKVKKKKIVRIKPKNIAHQSLFTEPAFKPKISRTGEDYKKYKRIKKVIIDD